ncbi:helix-turn-helix domain-containing protein [Streptomyces sp. NPDC090023]|uniref:helix-turn-helix domain-containing protein n=1 Tax=unclassified Streptomyces TaxID=2593676 RepID=UPI00380F5064
MPQPPGSKELPVSLLTDPAMIGACRARDFARVFHLVKVRAGIYPSTIARRCDLTPSRVGEVMAGRRHLLHMDVIERIADGLRIPGHMLGLAQRSWEAPEIPVVTSCERGEEPDPFVAHPAAGLPGADVDSILALASERDISSSTLEALHSSITDYWRRDDEHGGEVLRPAIVGQLRYVVGLLSEQRPAPMRDGLHSVAAELARLTGWTYFDARQYNQARAYFTEAPGLAKAVDDRQLMANVLACMSLQATYQDKPGDALALVSAAQDQVRGARGTTPRVLAMLAMREAFAHATLGNHIATHAAISAAHRQFELISAGDPDPAWVAYFDEPKLMVDTGIAHGRLGEAAEAEPIVENALRHEYRSNHRGRAFHSFWLARIQLQCGKLDEACHTAMDALAPTVAVGSQRVVGHLREFCEQLEPHRREPVAVAFESRLREVLPRQVSGVTRP